jgi:hypothetical protein
VTNPLPPARRRNLLRRFGIAVVASAAVSGLIGGVWHWYGIPGNPGPVFGVVFAMVFLLVR